MFVSGNIKGNNFDNRNNYDGNEFRFDYIYHLLYLQGKFIL